MLTKHGSMANGRPSRSDYILVLMWIYDHFHFP